MNFDPLKSIPSLESEWYHSFRQHDLAETNFEAFFDRMEISSNVGLF